MAQNSEEMFESSVRSSGDRAGVFEYEDSVGYFYLYDIDASEGHRVIGAIPILAGPADFSARDLRIEWDPDEWIVGLWIRDTLWAAFDVRTGVKHGGGYRADQPSPVPPDIQQAFREEDAGW